MSGNGPHSNESSPMSLSGHPDHLSDRASGRASPVPSTGGPRRKQARPRRRSGDSVNSSLDLSKAGSPPLSYGKQRDSPSDSVGGGDERRFTVPWLMRAVRQSIQPYIVPLLIWLPFCEQIYHFIFESRDFCL